MRDALSFTAIFATCLATSIAGFIWWVPIAGTIALCATSQVWSYARQVCSRDLINGAIPIYLQSIANAAMAIGGATAFGLVVKLVSSL